MNSIKGLWYAIRNAHTGEILGKKKIVNTLNLSNYPGPVVLLADGTNYILSYDEARNVEWDQPKLVDVAILGEPSKEEKVISVVTTETTLGSLKDALSIKSDNKDKK